MDYDHHCLFLNRCVGRNNHRVFILFILALLFAHFIFSSTAGYYLYWSKRNEENWSSIALREVWVLVLFLMNILTFLWESWLLSEQFKVIATGSTFYFRQNQHKKHSWGKRFATALSFLLEGKRISGPHLNTVLWLNHYFHLFRPDLKHQCLDIIVKIFLLLFKLIITIFVISHFYVNLLNTMTQMWPFYMFILF